MKIARLLRCAFFSVRFRVMVAVTVAIMIFLYWFSWALHLGSARIWSPF